VCGRLIVASHVSAWTAHTRSQFCCRSLLKCTGCGKKEARIFLHFLSNLLKFINKILSTKLDVLCAPEHVSGAQGQNFPLLAQLHFQESRSPLRSRSDDFPLRSAHAPLDFLKAHSPLRSAHLTF